jgi:hypothetical protein
MRSQIKPLILPLVLLIIFVQSVWADNDFSVKDLRIKSGWGLSFNDGLEFTIEKTGNQEIVSHWNLEKLGQLNLTKVSRVSPVDFSDLDKKSYAEYINKKHQENIDEWDAQKSAFDKKEQERYEQEISQYNTARKEFEERLKKEIEAWEKNKKEFIEQENKKYLELKNSIETDNIKKLAEYSKDLKDWEEAERKFIDEESKRIEKAKTKLKDELKGKISELNLKYGEIKDETEKKKLEENIAKLEEEYQKKIDQLKPQKFKGPKDWFGLGGPKPKPDNKTYLSPTPDFKPVEFSIPKPSRNFTKKPPSPPRPFSVPPPTKDDSPCYNFIGLLLYLGKSNCQQKDFILMLNKEFYSIKSNSFKTIGFSKWVGENTELVECSITTRNKIKNQRLLTILYDSGRPLSIEIKDKRNLTLNTIFSPELELFINQVKIRPLFVTNLDDFKNQSHQPIIANYTTDDGISFLVKYSVKEDQNEVTVLEYEGPEMLVNPSVTKKANQVKRVSYITVAQYRGKKHLFLRKHLWNYIGNNEHDWELLADYSYGIVEKKLANKITRKAINTQGDIVEQIISSAGLVFDFTSLWYLPAWYSNQKQSELYLGYYDENRIYGMILKKDDGIYRRVFREFADVSREITTERWILQSTGSGKSEFSFHIGVDNRIIYEVNIGENKVKLNSIKNRKISFNQKWYVGYKRKHNIVRLQEK